MSLKNWLANGWLVEHKTSPQEITGLLEVADRDLKDCQSPGLSSDWQLNIAYNAALQAAAAALAAAGYRASREAHHYRVIQSLAHTIKAELNLVNQFDQFRKKRNISGYELSGTISQQETNEMKSLAKKIRENVENWLRKNHPKLIS
jgi:HEPN domain-containing protein